MGMFLAVYFPGPGDRPPLVEQARAGAQRQISQWWDQGWGMVDSWFPGDASDPSPQPSPTDTSAESTPLDPAINGNAAPTQLSAEKRQALQRQLNGLQIQMNDLVGQTAALEGQLGDRYPGDPIEVRLQRLGRQIDPGAVASTPIAPQGRSPQRPSTITLPTDSLFSDGQSTLRPDAIPILDSILPELQLKPDANIRVAAHTDTIGDRENNRELSLRQGRAVANYLSKKLGTQSRWTVVGFGETRPVSGDGNASAQQRNRRIEIVVN